MVRCHGKAHVPVIRAISHVDREKELHGFLCGSIYSYTYGAALGSL